MKKITVDSIRKTLESSKIRSAWDRGVREYAYEILDNIESSDDMNDPADFAVINTKLLARMALDGASTWAQYSESGCSLIYDGDIAERLCSPSELKRKKCGELAPNSRERWIDVQSLALHQAFRLIVNTIHDMRD